MIGTTSGRLLNWSLGRVIRRRLPFSIFVADEPHPMFGFRTCTSSASPAAKRFLVNLFAANGVFRVECFVLPRNEHGKAGGFGVRSTSVAAIIARQYAPLPTSGFAHRIFWSGSSFLIPSSIGIRSVSGASPVSFINRESSDFSAEVFPANFGTLMRL